MRRWQGEHHFDRLTADYIGSAIGGYFGEIFHINTAGATYAGKDSNSGKDYKHPLLTITAALAKCVDGRGDVILIHDYWQASGETWPIYVNKRAVHILGVAQEGLPYPAIHPATDVSCFELTSSGQYGSLGFLTIGGGSSGPGIEMGDDGQVDGYRIHHNVFGHQWFGTPLNGIRQIVTATRGGYGNVIEHNTFLGDAANCSGKITGAGIDMLSTTLPWFGNIYRFNVFMGVVKGIHLTHDHDAQIYENQFAIADTKGDAITLETACRGCWVNRNEAQNGGDAAITANPYLDLATGANNHWALNYAGAVVGYAAQA